MYSHQSVDWNDEPAEEQGGAESPAGVTDDICAQNSERKEDNGLTGAEENEWDRLLRIRCKNLFLGGFSTLPISIGTGFENVLHNSIRIYEKCIYKKK